MPHEGNQGAGEEQELVTPPPVGRGFADHPIRLHKQVRVTQKRLQSLLRLRKRGYHEAPNVIPRESQRHQGQCEKEQPNVKGDGFSCSEAMEQRIGEAGEEDEEVGGEDGSGGHPGHRRLVR